MLTDPKPHAQIDQLRDELWTGGLSNPMDAIKQLSQLLFLKWLDDVENQIERLRAQQREAEHLFQSLLQRAFRGKV